MDAAEPQSLFENVSLGVIGAIQIDLEGKAKGIAVPYRGQVWLSEREQALTANAPRNEKDNPFLPGGALKLIRKASDVGRARPIGEDQEVAAPAPPAEPAAEPLEGEPVDLAPPESAIPPPAPAGENEPNPPREEQPPVPPAPAPSAPSAPAGDAEPVKTGPLSTGNPSGEPAPGAPPKPKPKAPSE